MEGALARSMWLNVTIEHTRLSESPCATSDTETMLAIDFHRAVYWANHAVHRTRVPSWFGYPLYVPLPTQRDQPIPHVSRYHSV